MQKVYHKIHPKFKLNGMSYAIEALKAYGVHLTKQLIPYEVSLGNFLLNWLNSESSIKVNTSGSTGIPKEISLEKQYMVNSAIATGHFFNLKETYKALLCLPTDFIAGKMMLVRAIVLGLEIDCISPDSNPLENIKKSYDFCAMVPLQVQNSLIKLDCIKTLLVGGAPMSLDLKNKVQDKSTLIFETYGMTETITHIAAKKVNNFIDGDLAFSHNFKLLPGVTIAKDNRDCLVIKAPKVSKETIVTNDIVNIISETEFEWLGRYDSVINSGGIKLIPEQIEAKLADIISNRFFVAGIPDENLGQRLVLLIEGVIDIDKIHQKIKDLTTLKRFEIPKEIYCINSFLETKNGKIQRKKTVALLKR